MAAGPGTIVTYHSGAGNLGDVPAIVVCTHDSWVSGTGLSQPSSGSAYLMYWSVNGFSQTGAVSEGTSTGEYSLDTVEIPDV